MRSKKNAFNLFKQQFRSCVNKLKAFLLSMGILKRKQFPCPCHIISGLSLKNRSEIFRPYNFKKSRESRLGKGFRFHDQIHRKCLKRNKIQKSGLVCCVFFSKSWICLVRSNSCGSGNIRYQFSMVTRYAGWRNFFWEKKLVQVNPWCTSFSRLAIFMSLQAKSIRPESFKGFPEGT